MFVLKIHKRAVAFGRYHLWSAFGGNGPGAMPVTFSAFGCRSVKSNEVSPLKVLGKPLRVLCEVRVTAPCVGL